MARTRRLARLAALGLLFTWSAALAADQVVPRELQPDAQLPEVAVEVELGQRDYSLSEEQKNGREVVDFYNKEGKLLVEPELQKRIEAIGHRIITAASTLGPTQMRVDVDGPPKPEGMNFTFRVLDNDDVNAFSAWGGNIYLTRGLIEFCQSDDELAGIIAHEVAHSMYHHLREQVRQVQKYTAQQAIALLAAAFMGINVGHVAGIIQWVHLALLNGHSVDDETQADWAGCFYAYRAGYNPVGMITCFERLDRLMRRRPHVKDLGAFQTHPWSDERAKVLETQIKALGLPIDRRAVTKAITAGVRSTPVEDGPPNVELLLGETLLMRMVAGDEAITPEDRAADAAYAINRALGRGLRAVDLQLVNRGQAWTIRTLTRLRPVDLFSIEAADAAAAGVAPATFARGVYQRFVARCRQEEINRGAL